MREPTTGFVWKPVPAAPWGCTENLCCSGITKLQLRKPGFADQRSMGESRGVGMPAYIFMDFSSRTLLGFRV